MVLADGSERVDDFGELESESVLSCSFARIFFLILEYSFDKEQSTSCPSGSGLIPAGLHLQA